MSPSGPLESVVLDLIIVAILFVVGLWSQRRRLSGSAFGTATFAQEWLMRKWGFLGNQGLIIGRTLSGMLIRVPDFCHCLLVGATGSGKGVGVYLPNLLLYRRGSVLCFDCDGALYSVSHRRRRKFGRVIRLAPFSGGHRWNILDTISPCDPLLIDRARALGWSLIVSPTMGPHDPHWDSRAGGTLIAILVYVLIKLVGPERSLNSVHSIASDHTVLHTVAGRLKAMGGIPARMGSQVLSMYNPDGTLTKEGSGILSTLGRHLDFLSSDFIAASLAESDWDVRELLVPGTTVFLQIPTSQLDACKGLLRVWVSTIIRALGEESTEEKNEILCLFDEADALAGLPAVEQILIRGRSSGFRLLLAYQSDSQVQAAFKDKPSLIPDNCGLQIYLGAGSIEVAERLSKMLGNWTQSVKSFADSSSYNGSGNGGGQRSTGTSTNYAPQGRPLFYPDEILRMSSEFFFAFYTAFPAPVIGRRIRYYAEREFTPNAPKPRRAWRLWRVRPAWLLIALGAFGIFAHAVCEKQPSRPNYRVAPGLKQQKKGGDVKDMKAPPVMWR